MRSRRGFLAGALAAGLMPRATWADAGSPAFLTAALRPDGQYLLCGLSEAGGLLFTIPIPGRGHAACAHPSRPEAVAFARRPGTFAMVIDCGSGDVTARLEAPEGRHFYGHGAFDAGGDVLLTTENDFDAGRGVIGVWDARNGYRRMGEFASGGVGPHDIKVLPGGGFVVANGGIETHPDTGRIKLNIPTMRPNLSILEEQGAVADVIELAPELHKNSIRHLAVAENGTIAFAMQWQGDQTADVPLLGVTRADGSGDVRLTASARGYVGYLGSIALSPDGGQIAVTSPRSGVLTMFDAESLARVQQEDLPDVCGVVGRSAGFLATTGAGYVWEQAAGTPPVQHDLMWDNHLVRVG